MLAVRIRAENWPTSLINSIHCCGKLRSGIFTVRGAVARVRAVNRCAILHIGPVVAFLNHWRAFYDEIRAEQSCVIIVNIGVVTFFFLDALLDLAIV